MAADLISLLFLATSSISLGIENVLKQQHQSHLRASKAVVSRANATTHMTHDPQLPAFLAHMAAECQCVFHGACTCHTQMEFMNCIKNACMSGKCACEGNHFLDACNAMDVTCPEHAHLQCSADKATCLSSEVVRPGAAAGAAAGALAAPAPGAVAAPAPSISTTIALDDSHLFDLHDDPPTKPPGFKRFKNVTNKYKPSWHNTFDFADRSKFTWKQAILASLVYIVFGTLFAYIYWKMYVYSAPTEIGNRLGQSWFAMKQLVERKHGDFNHSLFGCTNSPKLFVFSCLLPACVWSHTADRFRIAPNITYWPAFAMIFTLMFISEWTQGVAGILIVVLAVYFRQNMRKRYRIAFCTCKTISLDCLAWIFCAPCAITQEHCEEHFQATHPFEH